MPADALGRKYSPEKSDPQPARKTRKWVTLEVQVEWRHDEPEPHRPDVAKAVADCTVGALKCTDYPFDILQIGEADPQQLAYDA